MNNAVLVLNQNYEPLNVCDVRRALVLVFGDKADILEPGHEYMHTSSSKYQIPSVIRLRAFVRKPRPHVRLARREVFARDRFSCQYCGSTEKELTIDHIVPRSRGGQHEWTNVVACCKFCNHRKGNKSLIEAHMELRTIPREPRPSMYYSIERRFDLSGQPDWLKFLPGIEILTVESHSLSESPALN